MKKPKENASQARKNREGRKQILLYMSEKLIKALKLAAIEEGRPAYLIAEDAFEAYLKARKSKSRTGR